MNRQAGLFTSFFVITINETVNTQTGVVAIANLNQRGPAPAQVFVLMPQIVT